MLPRFHFPAGHCPQNQPSKPVPFESFRAHIGRCPLFRADDAVGLSQRPPDVQDGIALSRNRGGRFALLAR